MLLAVIEIRFNDFTSFFSDLKGLSWEVVIYISMENIV
ncbi:hypothetical protein B4166_2924 [Caldibacillus thermoamylovorans]|nr:hypothetical protein B4166_2924 [Caldibacillus thermoamylovorans]